MALCRECVRQVHAKVFVYGLVASLFLSVAKLLWPWIDERYLLPVFTACAAYSLHSLAHLIIEGD